MNYNILFLDVDGTLKQEPYGISDKNKEAITYACKQGKKISIASGRNKDMILRTVKELQLDEFGESYTVALNGAHIVDNLTKNTLHTVPIPFDLTKLLFEKAYEYEFTCHAYTENLVYFNYNDYQFEWYQKEGCTCKLVDMEKPDLGIEEIPLKFFLLSKDKPKMERFKEDLEPYVDGILNAEFSSKFTLEYTSIHASKGLGLEYVCKLFGYPLQTSIAAGDGENDISMLQMAGLGVAMKNALDTVKEKADIITELSCKENGVTEIIHKYLLKDK
ncbi:HAD family hydrolase [Mobilitalea sibirica]|uniref:HAD family hydrolase n=1 Tax=Mobilitalea sibirica TaxID=1462919 RepID=A0A8J7HBR9_9FIRM|nr:Cof-type HAD-IIB family hydrolase [Mobilitalea sibirica]MBH1941411.1 HAD family hydrolase [Mobilitalea sibirica]